MTQNYPVDFVESKSQQLLDRSMSDSDLCKLLSNGSEPTVDAVIYMLPHTGMATWYLLYIRA